jgi:hypothetical protein
MSDNAISKASASGMFNLDENRPQARPDYFLALQTLSKVLKRKQVHPLRKRRRAEKISPSCPL